MNRIMVRTQTVTEEIKKKHANGIACIRLVLIIVYVLSLSISSISGQEFTPSSNLKYMIADALDYEDKAKDVLQEIDTTFDRHSIFLNALISNDQLSSFSSLCDSAISIYDKAILIDPSYASRRGKLIELLGSIHLFKYMINFQHGNEIKLPHDLFKGFVKEHLTIALNETEENGIFVTSDRTAYFCLFYLTQVKGIRKDVTPLFLKDFERHQQLHYLTQKTGYVPSITKNQMNILRQYSFEIKQGYDSALSIKTLSKVLFNAVSGSNTYFVNVDGLPRVKVNYLGKNITLLLRKRYEYFRLEDLLLLDLLDNTKKRSFSFSIKGAPRYLDRYLIYNVFSRQLKSDLNMNRFGGHEVSKKVKASLLNLAIKDTVLTEDQIGLLKGISPKYIYLIESNEFENEELFERFYDNILNKYAMSKQHLPISFLDNLFQNNKNEYALAFLEEYITRGSRPEDIQAILIHTPEVNRQEVFTFFEAKKIDYSEVVYPFREDVGVGFKKGEKVILKPQYDDVKNLFHHDYLVSIKGKQGLISKSGEILIPSEYKVTTVDGFQREFLVRFNHKVGVYRINKNDVFSEIIPMLYDSIEILSAITSSYKCYQGVGIKYFSNRDYNSKEVVIDPNTNLMTPVLEANTENGTKADEDVIPTANSQKDVYFDLYETDDELPSFPGGMEALYKFLSNNIQYPVVALDNNIQGTVYVQFTVMKDGSITNPIVIHGVHSILNKEAIRVVKLMPKWNAGSKDRESIESKYTMPINFSIPDE